MVARTSMAVSSAKRVARTGEYLLFSGFISVVSKMCRRSTKRRVVKRYAEEIRQSFERLRVVIKAELANFLTPGEKMEFVRAIHAQAPAYQKYYKLKV
jgi:hypothetical protein